MNIYEYLFAGVLIIALLIGSSVMVVTVSTPTSNASDKDLLKVTAEKVMTQILLDPGYPYDWGVNNTAAQNLQVFGLAQFGDSSRQAYELDPDKVMRLNSSSVNATTAARLLGLGNNYGTLDYGFTMQFNQTISVNSVQFGNNEYLVKVTSDYGLPVIGASVSAVLYYANSGSITPIGPIYNSTTYDGTCILSFNNINSDNAKVLSVAVDYYGAQAAKLFGESAKSVPASLFGNNVQLASNPYATWTNCSEIILIQGSNGIETRGFKENIGDVNSNGFVLQDMPEPAAIGALIASGQSLIFAQREYSNIDYQTINLSTTNPSAALSYSLERTVLIGGTTYTVTLYIWGMST